MDKIKQHYIENLAEAFRTNFEEQAGVEIDTGKDFDFEQIINFYGGIIEYADLGKDNGLLLNAYVQKISGEDGFDFKIIIDKNTAEDLKNSGNGNWGLRLMELFYHVILSSEKFDSLEIGQIVYPDEQTVKKVLDKISSGTASEFI